MLTQPEPIIPKPSDVFLDTEGIAERYRIGLTKANELVRSPGFPASIVPGVVRIPLAALRTWEMAASLADTAADPGRASDPLTCWRLLRLVRPAARRGRRWGDGCP